MNLGQRPTTESSFWDWFFASIGFLSPTLCILFLMLINSIWHARNALLWDGKLANPTFVSYFASLQLDAFTKAQPASQPQSVHLISRWSSPPTGWIKINVDGAFCAASKIGGIGVIFRGKASSYAGGFVRRISHVNNPYTVELLAARDGLFWQCYRTFKGVGSLKRGSSSMDLLVDDVRESLQGFGSSKICHIPHSANGAAHSLAKLALVFSFNFHWFEESLDIIQDIRFKDCTPSFLYKQNYYRFL
ncbi:ribonuclease H protein [Pyrus ussuriensis x Pyrus communis]|uniref:Ribonuclease H protein n=1 Tax=Pyrus ussuriensis x Pyrus communis TaxID=2448454 RepID=A0A5N5GRW4_9ROSA|nr:ribonuclease H protein [Pyrus ussuriensis x Pyrus communis]